MSREAELYKDKIEVSLDGRQIFYLFFGGAVIVGLVFVLGVMVGRRVEARGHVDRARVAATVDPLAALDRLEGGSSLSFQGALRGGDAPASDVEKQIAAMEAKPAVEPKKGDKAPKADGPKIDKKDEPTVAPKKADAPKVEPKQDEPKVDKKAEPKKDEPKADAAKVEAKKADANVAKVEPKKADEPVTKPADVAKAEPKKDDKKAEDKKRYTLQLSSFQDKAEAEALIASVKAAGHDAYIQEGTVDGKQYFRVRSGTYKSQEAANEARGELEKISNKSAIVSKL